MRNKQQVTNNKKQDFRREFSAGGVVFKKLETQNSKFKIKWLIGKHSGYHKWVLPKGLIEEGERGFETATREVEEEMGIKAKLISGKAIHTVKYYYWAEFKKESGIMNPANQAGKQKLRDDNEIISYKQSDEKSPTRRVSKYQEEGGRKVRVFKVVSFYLMEYVSGDPKEHDWEMEEAGWFAFDEARDKLAFEGEREALEIAQTRVKKLT